MELPVRERKKVMMRIAVMERKIETGVQEHAGKEDRQ